MKELTYTSAVKEIKDTILESRYRAAKLVNKELLSLYFHIGKYVSFHTRNKNWGLGAIDIISNQLQQELPGLRGFSATNIKNMRIFYEEWDFLSASIFDKNKFKYLTISEIKVRQLTTDELKNTNRQLLTDDLEKKLLLFFMQVGFTHHIMIHEMNDLDTPISHIFVGATRQ